MTLESNSIVLASTDDGREGILKITVGVLAVQGAFFEHQASLLTAASSLDDFCNLSRNGRKIEMQVIEVRNGDDFKSEFDGLIIPGGESTVMSRFLSANNLNSKLVEWMGRQQDKPVVWGTCAGLILLANSIEGQKEGGQDNIGGLDVTVSRNYFGRQINSFEGLVKIKNENLKDLFGKDSFHGVFIRAPAVLSCDSDKVNVLGTIEDSRNNNEVVVAVQQDNLIATSFHPELTNDLCWHQFFIKQILKNKHVIS